MASLVYGAETADHISRKLCLRVAATDVAAKASESCDWWLSSQRYDKSLYVSATGKEVSKKTNRKSTLRTL